MDDQGEFVIGRKNNKTIGVIMTYISREIQFHASGVDFPHAI